MGLLSLRASQTQPLSKCRHTLFQVRLFYGFAHRLGKLPTMLFLSHSIHGYKWHSMKHTIIQLVCTVTMGSGKSCGFHCKRGRFLHPFQVCIRKRIPQFIYPLPASGSVFFSLYIIVRFIGTFKYFWGQMGTFFSLIHNKRDQFLFDKSSLPTHSLFRSGQRSLPVSCTG